VKAVERATRTHWWAGALLLTGCAAVRASSGSQPVQDAVGCYVVLQVRQTEGPTIDFLFPGFFSLDSVAVPDAAVPGQQVLLPVTTSPGAPVPGRGSVAPIPSS